MIHNYIMLAQHLNSQGYINYCFRTVLLEGMTCNNVLIECVQDYILGYAMKSFNQVGRKEGVAWGGSVPRTGVSVEGCEN